MGDIPDYTDEIEEPSENEIEKLNELILRQMEQELKVADLEDELKEAKKILRMYKEQLVPELMTKLGMATVTTLGGAHVSVKKDVRASFPKDEIKRQEAFDYIKETGNEGLIKQDFHVSFGRNSSEQAAQFKKLLEEYNIPAQHNEGVHHQTLLAFLRRELEAGNNVPLDAFGATQIQSAVLKLKR